MMELMDLMGRDITETGPSLTTYCKGNSCTLKDSMTRNYIPGIDEEYKFTRPEFALFLGISTNALRMKMRRGAFGDMYVIRNGKYLFKRPGPMQDKRPLVDHVAAPAGTIKRIRNRGAHKNGTAKYTSDAFRRHNEMKILNSINGKFKSDEHRRRFEELNDAALKKIDEDIKAEKVKQAKSLVHDQRSKNNRYVSMAPGATKYGSMLNARGLQQQHNKLLNRIDRVEDAKYRVSTNNNFTGSVSFGRYRGYDIVEQDDTVEVPGVYEGETYRNELEEIPRGMSKVQEEIWKLKNKKV